MNRLINCFFRAVLSIFFSSYSYYSTNDYVLENILADEGRLAKLFFLTDDGTYSSSDSEARPELVLSDDES